MIDQVFIRNLGIIILAAALIALVARRLKLPTILAYLVAGLAVGPGLGWVQTNPTLDVISEAGIVLLLFLVGLELSFDKIKGVGRAVLFTGIWQISLTAVGGFALCWALGFPPMESLLIGLALMFSSTVIVIKLLEEKKELDSLHGKISVGVLLLQDLVVIILLTVLTGFRADETLSWGKVTMDLGRSLAGIAVLLGMTWGALRWLLPRPFAWAAQSPETLFVWSLFWCFFVVFIAHLLHLSPETGAFLAGISLAQLPYNHELKRRVHPLMNFFIAVFFVMLGIQMNLPDMAAQWQPALVLTGFVVIGKFCVVMWLLARSGYPTKTAHFSAVNLCQISEFSLIFVAVLERQGFVDGSIVALVAMVALLTFSISCCAILYNESLYDWVVRLGLLRVFGRLRKPSFPLPTTRERRGHIIVVGMNTMGRMIARQLADKGEAVLAIDTDPGKLSGLPCETMLGNVEYLSALEQADLGTAKLVVSALRIEPTNDLLAYRCRSAGVPCSIHVVDVSVVDNLLAMDTDYLMISKVDGVKLQTEELKRRGFLPT